MSKFLQRAFVFTAAFLLTTTVFAQQLTNANFEDWSGAAFDGNPQPKGWNASNVEQFGFKFNFAHKESGHNGGYCMMVQDQSVGAAGITETSPGYFSLGQPWAYVPGLTSVGKATAGTSGGLNWTYRPDSMSVWIKRTGNNTDKEDFYLLYYAWEREAQGTAYKGKNGECTSYSQTNEESDVRIALNGNECSTTVSGEQVSEGMWREKRTYGDWTKIVVPIYYLNSNAPKYMNIIFSASNYPNFRANSGLYEGNSLYVDDVELIYSAKIQTLIVDGIAWNGFDPNTQEVQYYALGESATVVPEVKAKRGEGTLTNAKGTSKKFPGRYLEIGAGKEMQVEYGNLTDKPTVITVTSGDKKKTMVYRVQFQKAASSNAKLAAITYALGTDTLDIPEFSPTTTNYVLELPFGTTKVPFIGYRYQENGQSAVVKQATSLTDQAVINVTAPNKKDTREYRVSFRIAELADNNLAGIRVNGKDLPGFNPATTNYKVSLPVGTSTLTVEPVSKPEYGDKQRVVITPATMPTGEAINGTVVELSVTTPGNATPRKYRLTIKLEASSYSYLANLDITGDQIYKVNPAQANDSTKIDFTPENMIYYVTLKMGTTTLPTITPTKGDSYQAEPIIETAGVDGTTRVTATAGNGDQSVYKIYFSTRKSSNSKLKGIQINGEALEDFDPNVTSYTVPLPIGSTDMPTITWTPGDEYQKVDIVMGNLNTKTRITVTAGNGSMTVYQIGFKVDAYTDNTLDTLYVEGYEINYHPDTLKYVVNLAKGTTVATMPKVVYKAKAESPLQTVTARGFNGVEGDYKITVRPQSGASRMYTITFQLNRSSNAKLAGIKIDSNPIDTFMPEKNYYIDTLAPGISTIPKVTPVLGESSQKIIKNVLDGMTQVIVVQAEDKVHTMTYYVQFVLQVSTDATLKMIYLDGKQLKDFDPEVTRYDECYLTGETCPAVTVDANPGQQVTITTPYSTGEATIRVTAGGAVNVYVLKFIERKKESTQLASITKDGVDIDGFDPTKNDYKTTYTKNRPVIVGVPAYPGQKVSETLWNDSVAWIYVTDTLGNKDAYTVTCRRLVSAENKLKWIKADGTIIPGFDKTVTEYEYPLAQDAPYPTITYQVEDDAEVVFFGQTAEGVWTIKVAAENGAISTYTVKYTVAKLTDVTLEDLEVEGDPFVYSETVKSYNGGELGEGETMPKVRAKAKKGQTVLVYEEDENTQRVVIHAENGDSTSYVIRYTRAQNDNTQLDSLYIDGKRYLAFHPDTLNYTIELERGTTVVPNVFPYGHVANQTIITTFGQPNQATTVLVKSQKGTTRTYTINFPIRKSTNAALKTLRINNEIKDVDVTEYVFDVPFGTAETYPVLFEKNEGQLIEYIDAPITGTTKIIVRPEAGEPRTYTISYNILQPTKENIIKRISYKYGKNGTMTEGSIVPVLGDNRIELPVGTDSFTVVGVDTNYFEQSYLLYNGGIRRGAKIIALSNTDKKDAVYTITPVIQADTIGKLKDLKFRGVTVPNFSPDVYNYMVNVTDETPVETSDFTYTKYVATENVSKSDLNHQKKQITIEVEGGKTYSICWFYVADEAPLTFNWEQTNSAMFYTSSLGGSVNEAGLRSPTGYKPHGWSVPADYFTGIDYDATVSHFVYYSGKEVTRIGNNELILSTIRGGALNSSIPGAMTLGSLAFRNGIQKSGNTIVEFDRSASAGVQFRNTPEKFEFDYQPISKFDINNWQSWISLEGENGDTIEYVMNGNYSGLGSGEWYTATQPLIYNFIVKKLNIMLCSSEIKPAWTETINEGSWIKPKYVDYYRNGDFNVYDGGTSCNADLQVRNVRFVYNSALTAATVNGNNAPLQSDGRTFLYNVPANTAIIGKPALQFTGAVHDQMQVIEWLNDGEWINGELTARVINYGENSLDSTHYYVVIKRAPVTTFAHKAKFSVDYAKTVKGDSVFFTLPYGTTKLPILTITPNSIHQRFDVTKEDNTITVKVTNELGADSTTVYVFVPETSNSTELAAFERKDEGTMTGDGTNYTVVENVMPEITWTKEHAGQKVHITYTADGATVVITALDGKTTATRTITRNTPYVYVKAAMQNFTAGSTDEWPATILTNLVETAKKPNVPVLFTRMSDAAAVVFGQTPDSMYWHVTGNESNDTTYVLRYPTGASDDAHLKSILLNGKQINNFDPDIFEYDEYTDSAAIVEAVPAEQAQQMHMTMTNIEGGVQYQIKVTAEDQASDTTYTLNVTKPKSDIKTLKAIRLDEQMIKGFNPDTLDYIYEIASPKYKKEQPQMPSITYEAGQKGQKVIITPSLVFNNPTTLEVIAENGTNQVYSIYVRSQKSACTELSGITVNGAPLEGFEPGRHNYSVSLKDTVVELAYTTEDNFQTYTFDTTIVTSGKMYMYGITVTAENGETSHYVIDVYVERLSDDTQLANITLNGKNINEYAKKENPDQIPFDPGTNRYTINMHADSTTLPTVRAELANDNQTVQIKTQGNDTILLEVSVKDNPLKKNTYHLFFNRWKSDSVDLAMIYLDGEPLTYLQRDNTSEALKYDTLPYRPNKYTYTVRLKEGIHVLPEVSWDQYSKQHVDSTWDRDNYQVQLNVLAEDSIATAQYTLTFQFTKSAADTLLSIMANGVELEGFKPSKLAYTDSLEVGTESFPILSWQEKDDYQVITLDTVSVSPDGSQMVRSIHVQAENLQSKTYFITHVIRQSSIATLTSLIVDSKPLPDFDPNKDVYNYELTAEQALAFKDSLPLVEWLEGDEYQKIVCTQAPDTLTEKNLGQMSIVTVTAASGATMRYIIHYPVALSTDARLNMIMVGGKPLANFDSDRSNYKMEIDANSAVPVVSVIKKEEAQNYEIRVMGDTVRIVVMAESRLDSLTYQIAFERILSGNTKLNNIILTDVAKAFVSASQFRFNPAWDSYTVDLNWEPGMIKDSLLPTMEFDLADTLQTVRTVQTELEDGSIQIEIIVTAANKDEGSYFITFKFAKPADNNLKNVFFKGLSFSELVPRMSDVFSPMELEYTYLHPYGTSESEYFTLEDLTYELSDSLATATDSINDEYTIFITVTAQNGKQKIYAINQKEDEDDNADLAWIAVDGNMIKGFDPAITYYEYPVFKGAATPSVTAKEVSPNIQGLTVDDINKLGDTCTIKIKAAKGNIKTYYVRIYESIDKAVPPTSNDVLIKRVPGAAQFFVATIRSGVSFALFDLNRQLLFEHQGLPEADPSYAETGKNIEGKDVLVDVPIESGKGLTVDVELGKPYIYVFWYNGHKVKSGVLIAQ